MNFTLADWSAVIAYLAITLALGLYFRSRSGRSVDDYFVSGRNVSWWLAGTSMVATTFAADTPLLVTGLVYTQGVAGNWLWWSFLLSGMMTVFLFARLWRRSAERTSCVGGTDHGNRDGRVRGGPRMLRARFRYRGQFRRPAAHQRPEQHWNVLLRTGRLRARARVLPQGIVFG